ncbi:thioredoxin domain-containing protein [Limibacter armeniacum]|uniref:thioredoxin domain-containing protein n=1 Tax=Limibacter armeniacum TaxID=466084 RepID=UPI002FE5D6F5
MESTQKKANRLIQESSPYLLQHAYNPVEWYPWGEEALTKAKKENKPIIVSIGYSSCHWCHVMERESFENDQLAALMNQHYICIKVDREERPDIDQIYMDAIQVMGIQGGWPLNVFLTPDAKPFYGGTYFPPQQWQQVLVQVAKAYTEHKSQLEESAEKFVQAINQSELEKYGIGKIQHEYTAERLDEMFVKLSHQFDPQNGGINKAPKFPMPTIWNFLLRYYDVSGNENALDHAKLTLNKMAWGGIYDQIGGGFARYSVDGQWFAPHFEKMLYDNAQLVSLYADAYALTRDKEYEQVIGDTIKFLKREMMSEEGGFYSALDADSEGIEGRFYVWTYEELEEVFEEEDLRLICDYYNATEAGNWEHSFNILHRSTSKEAFAKKHQMTVTELDDKVRNWKTALLKIREMRIRPGLDDKILASWNGLMLKGLVDAYAATGHTKYLHLAKKNAHFIASKMMTPEGKLWHSYKNGKASIEPYLEDYAAVIQGFTALYQVCFDAVWLERSEKMVNYTLEHFFDREEEMFYFTQDAASTLIARKKEIFDNVIPSSNSMMATNLYFLGILLEREDLLNTSRNMLGKMNKMLEVEVQYLANWACLYTAQVTPTAEVAIAGDELIAFAQGIHQEFIPNKVVAGAYTPEEQASKIPLLHHRDAIDGKTTVYVCRNRSCLRPVHSLAEALRDIKGIKQ